MMKRTWFLAFGSATLLTAVWAAAALAQATQQPTVPPTSQPPAQTQPKPPAQQQAPAQTQTPGQTGQTPAQGQNQTQIRSGTAQPQARQIQGRVVRTAEGSVVVRTPDNREVTVYTHPRTTYRANNRDVRFNDVRVGSDISFTYDLDGTRYLANSVVIGPAEPVPAQRVAPVDGTLVTGRVMRVVGTDQLIIQTSDGREVSVYVTPQTVYQLTLHGGAFVDVSPGLDVGVYYDVRDNRFLARRIARRTR